MMYRNLELYKTTFALLSLIFSKYKSHYKFIKRLLRIFYIAQLLLFIYAFMCCAALGNKVPLRLPSAKWRRMSQSQLECVHVNGVFKF